MSDEPVYRLPPRDVEGSDCIFVSEAGKLDVGLGRDNEVEASLG